MCIDLARFPDLNEHGLCKGGYPAEGSDTIPFKHTQNGVCVTAITEIPQF